MYNCSMLRRNVFVRCLTHDDSNIIMISQSAITCSKAIIRVLEKKAHELFIVYLLLTVNINPISTGIFRGSSELAPPQLPCLISEPFILWSLNLAFILAHIRRTKK